VRTVAVALLLLGGACGDNLVAPPDSGAPSAPSLFAPAVHYAAGMSPEAVAVADLDGDGHLDLAAGGSGSVAILHGIGDGTFGSASLAPDRLDATTGIVAADLDGDGVLDLAAVGGGTFAALYGVGSADMSNARVFDGIQWAYDVAVADLDGDGHPDVVAANGLGESVSVFLGQGSGFFVSARTFPAGHFPHSVVVADMDRDGVLDLVVADDLGWASGNPNLVSLLIGHGDGTFAAPISFEVGNTAEAAAVGDVDGDGRPDIVTANWSDGNTLLLTGRGFASPIELAGKPQDSTDVRLVDVDGDGRLDIVTAGIDITVQRNLGGGRFLPPEAYACGCGRLQIADVNGDGKPDVIGVGVSISDLGIDAEGGDLAILLHE
jgi:hypothetical protein